MKTKLIVTIWQPISYHKQQGRVYSRSNRENAWESQWRFGRPPALFQLIYFKTDPHVQLLICKEKFGKNSSTQRTHVLYIWTAEVRIVEHQQKLPLWERGVLWSAASKHLSMNPATHSECVTSYDEDARRCCASTTRLLMILQESYAPGASCSEYWRDSRGVTGGKN